MCSSKDSWKFLMASKPWFYLMASSGDLGKDAKDAADEYEKEILPLLAITAVICVIGFFVWLVGHLFGAW